MKTNTLFRNLRRAAGPFLGLLVLFSVYGGMANSPVVYADTTPAALPKTCDPAKDFCSPFHNATEDANKNDPKAGTSCDENAPIDPSKAQNSCNGQKLINKYITPAIAALSAMVGISVTVSIVWAAIQYTTAGGDSGKVSAAKQRILTALIVLIVYVFFYAFMKWFLPGSTI